MLVSFFLFETFKEDNLEDILPIQSYATTLRRKLVDFAAKVVHKGHEVILKVPQAVSVAVDDASRRGPDYGTRLRVDHRNSRAV
jgi:hypothetical protein